MNTISANDALDMLKEGNERFQQQQSDPGKFNISLERRAELVGHQDPFAIVLSCADSRVMPEVAFDSGIGDVFVVRVAGNVANTESIASIEYAVAHLKTNLIVVLGHQNCGACNAALVGGDNGHNLNVLLAHINQAVAQEGANGVNAVVKANAENQCRELIARSSILSDAVEDGDLRIVPAYYHLGTGAVDFETT